MACTERFRGWIGDATAAADSGTTIADAADDANDGAIEFDDFSVAPVIFIIVTVAVYTT